MIEEEQAVAVVSIHIGYAETSDPFARGVPQLHGSDKSIAVVGIEYASQEPPNAAWNSYASAPRLFSFDASTRSREEVDHSSSLLRGDKIPLAFLVMPKKIEEIAPFPDGAKRHYRWVRGNDGNSVDYLVGIFPHLTAGPKLLLGLP